MAGVQEQSPTTKKGNKRPQTAVIRPIKPQVARDFIFANHKTGRQSGGNLGYCFGLYGTMPVKLYGVATYGYNVSGGKTAHTLFGEHSQWTDYRDNLRLVCTKDHTGIMNVQPSGFLSFTTKVMFKELKRLKYIVAHAFALAGHRGTIYQAANYDYIGAVYTHQWWIPGYGRITEKTMNCVFKGDNAGTAAKLSVHPTMKKLRFPLFRYIRFRDEKTKKELMQYAKFRILPAASVPRKEDIIITDHQGNKYSWKDFANVSLRSYVRGLYVYRPPQRT